MSDATPPQDPPKTLEVIPLLDIDRLLESEDPGFAQSLEEVRSVESDQNIEIDASAIVEHEGHEDKFETGPESRRVRIRFWLRSRWAMLRARVKVLARDAVRDLWIFLKVRPKEYALYSIKLTRLGVKSLAIAIQTLAKFDRRQKLTLLVLILVGVSSLWVMVQNFKGIWLPQINEPILNSFETVADSVTKFDASEKGLSFYSAFPQERHEFLFQKMKVNLRGTAEHPNAMGAFEIIVLLDSKDTAIEISDREVEFFDALQRVLEGESYGDLESEMGKNRLKTHIKADLDQKLTQGWIKDINYKTFILKP